jgi:AhpD family alkylhydroperoxidase
MAFKKRVYKNPKELFGDIRFLASNRKTVDGINGGSLIAPAFRERIMLAVTAVNGCRYCSYFHTKDALRSGLSQEEISRLLSKETGACPAEEATAIAYAQHWAESNACPDPTALQRLHEVYGTEKADAIQVVLRMIRVGNLTGNSFDYFLYRLSFGKRT